MKVGINSLDFDRAIGHDACPVILPESDFELYLVRVQILLIDLEVRHARTRSCPWQSRPRQLGSNLTMKEPTRATIWFNRSRSALLVAS